MKSRFSCSLLFISILSFFEIPKSDFRLAIIFFLDLRLKRCLLYTSDAADDGESVDLGGRRIIKKKKKKCFFFFSFFLSFFFFQAEDGIRDQPRSRGLGDVYKRQITDRDQ